MTGPDGGVPDVTAHERARMRTIRHLLAGGGVVGVAAAAGVAALGGSGQAGLVVLLLVWAFAASVTGLYGLVMGFLDDARRRPVGRRRVVTAVGLLVGGFVLLLMAFGAAA